MDDLMLAQVSTKRKPILGAELTDVVTLFRAHVAEGPRGTTKAIAQATGIPLKTLRGLYYGRTQSLRWPSMKKLALYYRHRSKRANH